MGTTYSRHAARRRSIDIKDVIVLDDDDPAAPEIIDLTDDEPSTSRRQHKSTSVAKDVKYKPPPPHEDVIYIPRVSSTLKIAPPAEMSDNSVEITDVRRHISFNDESVEKKVRFAFFYSISTLYCLFSRTYQKGTSQGRRAEPHFGSLIKTRQ